MIYRCAKCGGLRSPEKWLAETAKTFQMNVSDVPPLKQHPTYVCPSCHRESSSTKIEIIEFGSQIKFFGVDTLEAAR